MTPLFRPIIFRYDSLPSTNTEAAEQARRGAPEGVTIVAREQTAGRGRHGRTWLSPPDAGLYVSTILRPHLERARLPLLTPMAALAVRAALLAETNLQTDIKFPNDVLAGTRKLCGILAEASFADAKHEAIADATIVLGIGINLRCEAFPPELAGVATSIETETGSAPDAEKLLARVLEDLSQRYTRLHEADGVTLLLAELAASSSFVNGKDVRVTLGDESFEGTTRGLAGDGALLVQTRVGETRAVHAGDVTAVRPVVTR